MPSKSGRSSTCSRTYTQAELGDAFGLSTVHVNRTLQDLRGEGLITLGSRSVTVKDWERLRAAGEFDPTYLHLKTQLRKPATFQIPSEGGDRRTGQAFSAAVTLVIFGYPKIAVSAGARWPDWLGVHRLAD